MVNIPQVSVQSTKDEAVTLLGLFQDAVQKNAGRTALMHKTGDRWHEISYEKLGEHVADAVHGLLDLGIDKGHRVAIFSRNNPQWAITDWAALQFGAVTVPIYDTLTAEKAEYILRDSEARVCVVEGPDHLNRIRKVRKRLPHLNTVVVMGEEVFEKTLEEGEVLFADLLRRGAAHRKKNPKELEKRRKAIKPDDWASIVYTSGTTGDPKGAILTHNNFGSNVLAVIDLVPLRQGMVALSFLPLSHVFERMAGHFTMIHAGMTIAYAESIEKLPENMAEVRPHVMLSVPRLYEKLYARIREKVNNDSWLKRKIFNWALGVGKQRLREKYELKVNNPSTEKKFKRADRLVFSKIRERTGGRLEFFVSGGAPLSPEIEEFFNAVNVPILQGYGLTETSPVLSVNAFSDMRLGSVGKAIPGADIKIAQDGEILAKGPMIFKGYHNKPDATKETFTDDGYFKTGDIGKLDDDGFLFITDRKKELIVMSNGKNVAPQPIEGLLKTKPGIGMVVVIGDNRKYISALISPDFEALEKKAKDLGVDTGDREALVRDERILGYFQEQVNVVNEGLSRYEQIKKFRVLTQELSLETGELTPTLKVKRRVINQKFNDLIESMYEGAATTSRPAKPEAKAA